MTAQERIVAALRGPVPQGGWNGGTLRKAAGLSGPDFHAALRALRMAGKMAFRGYALSASMLAAATAVPVEDHAVAASLPEVSPPAPMEPALAAMLAGDHFLTLDSGWDGFDRGKPLGKDAAAALLADVEVWCLSEGVKETLVGDILFRHPGFVGLLRKRGTVRATMALMVRALMVRWPGGLAIGDAQAARRAALARAADAARLRSMEVAPGACDGRDGAAKRVMADHVAREVEVAATRRQVARGTGTVARMDRLSAGGQVQDIVLRDAHQEAVSIVREQWPALWADICRHAGLTGLRPVPAMLALIRAGLAIECDCRREERA